MIHCKQVSKYFRTKRALHEVDVHIKDHSLIGLVGRNGAGKTTLLKLIAGCWKATSGNIKVLNTDPFDNLFVSTNSILIDDDIAFPETLTLKELFSISEQFYPNWDGQLAHRLLTYFSLNEAAYYHQLSKGGKSTFNAIVGLATHAPLTIFDEPTTGMDRSVRFDFYEALLKDYLNHPRLMIISSHHIEEIEHMLEELILIDEGKLVLQMSIDEVRDYAISVRGQSDVVRSWLQDKEILVEKSVGIDELEAVVKREASHVTSAQKYGFVINNVSAADLAIYLTEKRSGGIDDVFSETN